MSKTIIGALIMLLGPFLTNQLGFTPEDLQTLQDALIEAVGFALVAYGRYTAKHPINALGLVKKPEDTVL